MRKQPAPRYLVQSEILEKVAEHETSCLNDVMRVLENSWYWAKADQLNRSNLKERISIELFKLRVFGFLEQRGSNYTTTKAGRVAAKQMLSPFSVKNLIDNAKKVIESTANENLQTILLLGLVGIPFEIRGNDEIMKRVKIAPECEFVLNVLSQDEKLGEPPEGIKLCPQYATVLNYWVNSVSTELILKKCGLDPTADAALLEELLPSDAYWILQTLSRVPISELPMTERQRELLFNLSTWCKLGSSDEMVIKLLDLKLKHMGRNTAIKISEYLRGNNKSLQNITEADLCQIFTSNQEGAKYLFAELQEREIIT